MKGTQKQLSSWELLGRVLRCPHSRGCSSLWDIFQQPLRMEARVLLVDKGF